MCDTLKFCILTIFLSCCFCCTGVAGNEGPIVETSLGSVRGTYGAEAMVFKSIPYGGPVDGSNRWKDARPAEPWSGILDGTKDPPACPQNCDFKKNPILCPDPKIQKENCLFLNVFTPLTAKPNSRLPVMVFIPGGAYIVGYSAAPLYDGSYLASHSNIVVVTMNYRLGALGFLVHGTGHNAIEGNFGIKDQRLALQWVQENIAYFGGDPSRVTLSGESAGAMSVAIHMTDMKSSGLFHKAIIESDPFGIDYRTVREERSHGTFFADRLECYGWFQSVYDCLHKKDVSEVLKAQQPIKFLSVLDLLKGHIWEHFLSWAPVIDGNELTDQPLALFEHGHFTKVPLIMGTNTAEGIMFVYGSMDFKVPGIMFVYGALDFEVPGMFYGPVMAAMFGHDNEKAAVKLYPPHGGAFADQRFQISEAVTDYAFFCPTILSDESIAAYASHVPVYSYIFNHPFPALGSEPQSDMARECKTHACHGAELPYVFHTCEFVGCTYTPEEKELADTVSEYWGNFVNTGNPNQPPGHQDPDGSCEAEACTPPLFDWPRYTTSTKSSLFLDVKESKVVGQYRKEYCDVVDRFGYGTDVFAALRHSADFVKAAADKE